ENQVDGLETLGVGATHELLALAVDQLLEPGDRLIDEGEDRAGGDAGAVPQCRMLAWSVAMVAAVIVGSSESLRGAAASTAASTSPKSASGSSIRVLAPARMRAAMRSDGGSQPVAADIPPGYYHVGQSA